MLAILGDYAGNEVEIDSTIKGLTVINADHHEIHDSDSYCAGYTVDVTGSSSHYSIFVTPASGYFHMVFDIATEGETDLAIYEGITCETSLSGTAITARNRDRNSDNTSSALIYQGASSSNITKGTTRIYPHACHWGTKNQVGSDQRGQAELILKQNTKYLYAIGNASASANYVGYTYSWYEK